MSAVLALCVGAVDLPAQAVPALALKRLTGLTLQSFPESYDTILFHLRLPRLLLAAIVGGSLALVGAVLQGIFRNPMADPGIIGVTSGASMGAVLAMSTGIAFAHPFALPACAFPGAVLASFLVYSLATRGGHTPISALLLSGIAVGSLLTAFTSLTLTLKGNIWLLRQMLFWLMGGLEGRGWSHLVLAGVPALLGGFLILAFARDLNILASGADEGAMTLGVNVRRVTQILLVLSSLVTGAVVSVSGGIGFVGLIVPHAIRLVLGPDHRVLLPASFLGGAIFLILADMVSRTLLASAEVRLGIVTALIGSPFFIVLLQRNLRRASWF